MANVILVHGMAANKKSWFGVRDFLKSDKIKKHIVHAETLPGHDGDFGSSANGAIGMADYIDAVFKQFPKFPDDVILVGHSMGGQVITHVAAQYPDRINRLIYVAAMLPQDGESANDIKKASGLNPEKFLQQLMRYRESDPDVFASQPMGPMRENFKLPESTDGSKLNDFRAIRRYYITCTKDDILRSGHQKVMIAAARIAPGNVEEIEADHIPQKSKPDELNAALKKFIEAG